MDWILTGTSYLKVEPAVSPKAVNGETFQFEIESEEITNKTR